MTPNKPLGSIFNEALDCDTAAERTRFLDEACGAHSGLRQRVEELLRAHDEAGGFLSHPQRSGMPPGAAGPGAPEPARLLEKAGDRIDRYKLLEQIGEGGCGVVYLAEQETPVRRRVALKIIKLGMDTRQVVARFEAERQALALMDHPNIARVLDAGATESGRPYFAMELVRGPRITEFCEERRLPPRERLGLFMQVCAAVQHAHQKGIIHRDLKPSNILVTIVDGKPVLKVIDFGIAKATSNQRLTDQTVFTAFEQFIGTPAYMSPEQAELGGVDIDTRTDIYSLGVVLYELLTGRTPFDTQELLRSGLEEARRTIREKEPSRPSTRLIHDLASESKIKSQKSKIDATGSRRLLQLKELIHVVKGDIDWVVMKCLEKDRSRRYETANALAMDIQRYLGNEPILARPPSNLYRLQKMARRHRPSAVALVVVLFLLVALVVEQTVSARRIAASHREMLRSLEALEVQKANNLFADGSTAEAVALLARRVRNDPNNRADCARLMWALQRRRWAVPKQAPYRPAGFLSAEEVVSEPFFKAPDDLRGRWLAVTVGTNLIVRDVLAGTNRHEWPLPFRPQQFAARDGKVELTDPEGRKWLFDALDGRMLGPAAQPSPEPGSANVVQFYCASNLLEGAADHSFRLLNRGAGTSKTLVPPSVGSVVGNEAHPPVAVPLEADRKLAFSDGEATVRVLDCATGELSGPTLRTSSRVEGLHASPDSRVLVTLTSEGAQFWDLRTGQELPTPPEVSPHLADGAFRPGRTEYILAANPSGLVFFNPLTGAVSRSPPRGDLADGYCLTDESGSFAAVTFGQCVAVFDALTGLPLCEPLTRVRFGRAWAFAGDDFLTRDAEGLTTQWTVRTNRAKALVLRHAACVQSAHFSPDGLRVVTASHDGTAQVWNARTGERVGKPLVHETKVWSACFSPDGRRVATASWDATARIWDAASGAPLSPPLRASNYVFYVEFSPDGQRLLVSGEDGVVRLYDGQTGQPVWALPPQGEVYWAHFSPDGRMVVTRPWNGNPALWDALSGSRLVELHEPPGRRADHGLITRGDFSRDGSWLALGSPENYATIWHLPDGRLHKVLNQATVVRTALFSPDARTVLTVADDLAAQLWDAQNGQARSSPLLGGRTHAATRVKSAQALRAAAIHPDGQRAVTGGSDGAARMWDLRTGLPLGEPAEFEGEVIETEFSPDGQRLLVACFDGTAHILPLPPFLDRAPDWLAPLAEGLVHERLDAQGAAQTVSPAALWEVCEALRHAPKDDPAVQWALDLLDL